MTITTRTGDNGSTDLLFEGRVRKDNPRVHVVGELDELNSWLGMAKCATRKKALRETLDAIQHDLFIVSSEFITLPKNLGKLQFRVDEAMVERLEQRRAEAEARVNLEGCCFLIPGENPLSATLDICRCVARRAERTAVSLHRRGSVPNRLVLVYLNRLSDLLFLLARTTEKRHVKFIAKHRYGKGAK